MRFSRIPLLVAPLSLAFLVQACAGGADEGGDVGPGPSGGASGKAGAGGKAGSTAKGGSAGKGGTSSKGGTGGSGGSDGDAGEGGSSSAGKGGSSGKGGSAGKGGASGKGGAAGDTGEGGTGGVAGAAGKGGGAGGTKPFGGSSGSGGSAGTSGKGGSAGKDGSAGAAGAAAAVCGNGIKESSEPCDGSDFGTSTCGSITGDNTLSGTLKCESCKIRTDGCTKAPVCGDKKINAATEQCDGDNVGTSTCASATGVATKTGELGCGADCKFDTSKCTDGDVCGDGKKNGAEACDKNDFAGASCASATNNTKPQGTLKCGADCKLDTSLCSDVVSCGDGKRNQASEKCDLTDLGGANCATFLGDPAAKGELACKADCTFDGAGCTLAASCGDGTIDTGEECDTNAFGGKTCESVKGPGWSGSLTCTSGCKISSATCVQGAACGDGIKNQASEYCDGSALDGKTCALIVGTGSTGTLACNPNCTFDTNGCTAPTLCGNGAVDAGEACDGSVPAGKTCATQLGNPAAIGALTCKACALDASACSIPNVCGDGKLGPNEECDDGNTTNGDGCNSSCKVVCRYGQKLGTHCYEEVTSTRSWASAQADCTSVNGHLVVFNNNAEEVWVINNIMREPGVDKYWIGLGDATVEGQYRWVNGEPFTYSNWRSGEPNNSGNEDCVEYAWSCSFFGGCSPDGWNDEGCGTTRSYVCEYPPPVKTPLRG